MRLSSTTGLGGLYQHSSLPSVQREAVHLILDIPRDIRFANTEQILASRGRHRIRCRILLAEQMRLRYAAFMRLQIPMPEPHFREPKINSQLEDNQQSK